MTKTVWNDENDAWLLENYSKKSTKDCAEHFGTSEDAIRVRANRLGISKGRFFTDKEKEYIDRNLGKASYSKIAKNVGRSYNSIKYYAYRNCNNMICNDKNKISTTEAARLVGRSRTAITRNWFKRGLKHRAVGGWYLINIDDLCKFMKNNQDLWDATQCEEWFFENYAWFREKRKDDSLKTRRKRWGEYYNV